MKKSKLLKYNDVRKDREIKAWEEVYLEEKRPDAPDGIKQCMIGDGESIHSVAQRYGMRLDTVKALNPGAKDRPGTMLKLR